MKKEKRVKAIHRKTVIGKTNRSVTEDIIEISVFIDNSNNLNKEDDCFSIHKTLLDAEGNEYEIIEEVIPFFNDIDYKRYIKQKKR